MPFYIFQHKKTKEVREIFFHMNDDKKYLGENGKEKDWERQFVIPQASFDTKTDCWDAKAFVEKTGKKKGTMGDIFDQSQAASEKRAQESGGLDPIREKRLKDYGNTRSGALHPELEKRGAKEKLAKKGIIISD